MVVSVFRLVGRRDLFFDGIRAILKGVHPDADIQQVDCSECFIPPEAEAVVIVDTTAVTLERLLAQDGIRIPSTRIVAVTESHSLNDLIGYLAMGAQGCVLRQQTATEFVDAIQRVSEGQVYLPNSVVGSSASNSGRSPSAMRRIEDRLEHPALGNEIHQVSPGGGIDLPHNRALSGRQRSVMVLMARGMTNKAIARELSLAEGTVKVHVNNVFKRLNVNNRVQAIAKLAQYEFQKLGSSLLMFLSIGFTDFII